MDAGGRVSGGGLGRPGQEVSFSYGGSKQAPAASSHPLSPSSGFSHARAKLLSVPIKKKKSLDSQAGLVTCPKRRRKESVEV